MPTQPTMDAQPAGSLIAFGAQSQIGDVSSGEVAGRDLIKTYNTLVMPAAPPTIVRQPAVPAAPRSLRGFRDRETEQQALRAELRPGGGSWLRSVGGLGASALLRQVASAAVPELADGVLLVDRRAILATDDEGDEGFLDDVVQYVFERFFCSSDPTQSVRVDLARASPYLRDLHAVFAFDRLPLARPQLERLADMLAGGAVLVAASGPALETLLDLPLRGLPRADALAFLRSAAAYDPADASQHDALDTLCAFLNDAPLALQIAGALLAAGRLSAAQMPALDAQAATAMARIARIAITCLSTEERAVLRGLTASEPDVGLDALAAIVEYTPTTCEALLDTLIELRLVVGAAGRYGIASFSLQQEFARLLEPTAERRAAAAFFASAALTRSGDALWVSSEAHNLFRALQTVLTNGNPELAGPLARALHPLLVRSGRWNAWGKLSAWATQAARLSGDRSLLAWALHERGVHQVLTGASIAGVADLRRALALREELGETLAAAQTRQCLAFAGVASPSARPRLRIAALLLVLLLLGAVGAAFVFGNPASAPTTPATAAALIPVLAASATPAPSATPTPTMPAVAAPVLVSVAPSATVGVAPVIVPSATVGVAPVIVPSATVGVAPVLASVAPSSTADPRNGTCLVRAAALNLRSGPDPRFPILRALPAGTALVPIAQAYGGAWLQVRIGALVGWLYSADQAILTCFLEPAALPLGLIPPLPTPTQAPSVVPSPTPTPTAPRREFPVTMVPVTVLPTVVPPSVPTVVPTPTPTATRPPRDEEPPLPLPPSATPLPPSVPPSATPSATPQRPSATPLPPSATPVPPSVPPSATPVPPSVPPSATPVPPPTETPLIPR